MLFIRLKNIDIPEQQQNKNKRLTGRDIVYQQILDLILIKDGLFSYLDVEFDFEAYRQDKKTMSWMEGRKYMESLYKIAEMLYQTETGDDGNYIKDVQNMVGDEGLENANYDQDDEELVKDQDQLFEKNTKNYYKRHQQIQCELNIRKIFKNLIDREKKNKEDISDNVQGIQQILDGYGKYNYQQIIKNMQESLEVQIDYKTVKYLRNLCNYYQDRKKIDFKSQDIFKLMKYLRIHKKIKTKEEYIIESLCDEQELQDYWEQQDYNQNNQKDKIEQIKKMYDKYDDDLDILEKCFIYLVKKGHDFIDLVDLETMNNIKYSMNNCGMIDPNSYDFRMFNIYFKKFKEFNGTDIIELMRDNDFEKGDHRNVMLGFIYELTIWDFNKYQQFMILSIKYIWLEFLQQNYVNQIIKMTIDQDQMQKVTKEEPQMILQIYQQTQNQKLKEFIKEKIKKSGSQDGQWINLFLENRFIIDFIAINNLTTRQQRIKMLSIFANHKLKKKVSVGLLKKVVDISNQMGDRENQNNQEEISIGEKLIEEYLIQGENSELKAIVFDYICNFEFEKLRRLIEVNFDKIQQYSTNQDLEQYDRNHNDPVMRQPNEESNINQGNKHHRQGGGQSNLDQLTLQDYNTIFNQRKSGLKYAMWKLKVSIDLNEMVNDWNELIYDEILEKRKKAYQQQIEKQQWFDEKLDTFKKYYDEKWVTTKLMISFILQLSSQELRVKLLHQIRLLYTVPLVSNMMVNKIHSQHASQKSDYQMIDCINMTKFNKTVFAELGQVIEWGFSILNLGLGKIGSIKIGKSSLFQRVVYEKTQQNILNIKESCQLTAGTIDLRCETIAQKKRKIIMLDVQGYIQQEIQKHITPLVNIFLLHLDYQELDEILNNQLDDSQLIHDLVEILKNMSNNSKVFLILRDAESDRVLKGGRNDQEDKLMGKLKQKVEQSQGDWDKIGFIVEFQRIIDYNEIDSDANNQLVKEFNQYLKELEKLEGTGNFNRPNFYRFVENMNGEQNNQNQQQSLDKLKKVDKFVDDFMNKVEEQKEDLRSERGLYCLKLQKEIKQKILSLQDENDTDKSNKMNDELRDQQKELEQLELSDMLKDFRRMLLDENVILIIWQLKKRINEYVLKNDLLRYQQEMAQIDESIRIMMIDGGNNQSDFNELKQKKRQCEEKIDKSFISIEHLQRCIFSYLENKGQKDGDKDKLNKQIAELIIKGEYVEIIDGDNLEFTGKPVMQILKEYKEQDNINRNNRSENQQKNYFDYQKILSLIVVGEQSSGKSTLLNHTFGTSFMTSQNRCTKGVGFSIQRLDCEGDIKYLMIIDTEGLQGSEKQDNEFDRKIMAFILQNSNIVIVNCKGDFNQNVKKTLEICTYSISKMKRLNINPQIMYSFVYRNDCQIKEKEICRDYIDGMWGELIGRFKNAKDDSLKKHVEKFKLNGDINKIFMLGMVHSDQKKDEEEGLRLIQSQFPIQAKELRERVLRVCKDYGDLIIKDINSQLKDAYYSWNAIERYSKRMMQYGQLVDYYHEQNMYDFIIELQNMLKTKIDIQKYINNNKSKYDNNLDIYESQNYNNVKNEIVDSFDNYLTKEIEEKLIKEMKDSWYKENTNVNQKISHQMDDRIRKLIDLYKQIFIKDLNDSMKKSIIDNFSNMITYSINKLVGEKSDDNQQNQDNYYEKMKVVFDTKRNELIEQLESDDQQAPFKQHKEFFYSFFIQYCNQFPNLNNKNQMKYEDTERDIKDFIIEYFEKVRQQFERQDVKMIFDFNEEKLKSLNPNIQDRFAQVDRKIIDIERFFKKENRYYKWQSKNIDKNAIKKEFDSLIDRKKIDEYSKNNDACDNLVDSLKGAKQLEKKFRDSGFVIKFQNVKVQNILEMQDENKGINLLKGFKSAKSGGLEISLQDRILVNDSIRKYLKNIREDQQIEGEDIPENYNEFSLIDNDKKCYWKFQKTICILDEKKINEFIEENSNIDGGKFKEQLKMFEEISSDNRSIGIKRMMMTRLLLQLINYKYLANRMIQLFDQKMGLSQEQQINQPMGLDIRLNNLDGIDRDVINRMIEDIDRDLGQLMGMNLSEAARADIYFCVYCIMLHKISNSQRQTMKNISDEFKNNEGEHTQMLKDIIKGNTKNLTIRMTKIMIKQIFNMYADNIKNEKQDELITKLQLFSKDYYFENKYPQVLNQFLETDQYDIDEAIHFFREPSEYYKQHVVKDYNSKFAEKTEEFVKEFVENSVKGTVQLSIQILETLKKTLQENQYNDEKIFDYLKIAKINQDEEDQQIIDSEVPKPTKKNLSKQLKQIFIDILFNDVEERYEFDSGQYIEVGEEMNSIKDKFYQKLASQHISVKGNEVLKLLREEKFYEDPNGIFQITEFIEFVSQMKEELGEIVEDIVSQFKFDKEIKFVEEKDKMQNKVKGCERQCMFCRALCQKGYHSLKEDSKHSCDVQGNYNQGHHLRAFAFGKIFTEDQKNKNKDELSVYTCNVIEKHSYIYIGDNRYSWAELQSNQQEDFDEAVENDVDDRNYRRFNKKLKAVWKKIGPKYCEKYGKGIQYKEERKTIFNQSLHIIFCVDDSQSIERIWNDIKKGFRQLIFRLRGNHENEDEVKITAITFNNSDYSGCGITQKYLKDISYKEVKDMSRESRTIDEMLTFHSGGTKLIKVFDKTLNILKTDFDNFDISYLIVFTDGLGESPRQQVKDFMKFINNDNKDITKLFVDLYDCSQNGSQAMKDIQKLLNQRDKPHVCNLKTKVKQSDFMNIFYESFESSNLQRR